MFVQAVSCTSKVITPTQKKILTVVEVIAFAIIATVIGVSIYLSGHGVLASSITAGATFSVATAVSLALLYYKMKPAKNPQPAKQDSIVTTFMSELNQSNALNLSEENKTAALKQLQSHAINMYQSWTNYFSKKKEINSNENENLIALDEIAIALHASINEVELLFKRYQFPTVSYNNIGCVNAFFIALCLHHHNNVTPRSVDLPIPPFWLHMMRGDAWWPESLIQAKSYDISTLSDLLGIPVPITKAMLGSVEDENQEITLQDIQKLSFNIASPERISIKWEVYDYKEGAWTDQRKRDLSLDIFSVNGAPPYIHLKSMSN